MRFKFNPVTGVLERTSLDISRYRLNPLTGVLDLVSLEANIPQVTVDPTSPAPEDAWVLFTQTGGEIGSSMGLLLALTYAEVFGTYQLSYKTLGGTIVRTLLT